mmetsp:Transcript_52588/g.125584  ORF Transcript_52588/g.125584 Transcript_52588/m.125584 type:complete len:171 (+) Transcript_52588:76-588(+)
MGATCCCESSGVAPVGMEIKDTYVARSSHPEPLTVEMPPADEGGPEHLSELHTESPLPQTRLEVVDGSGSPEQEDEFEVEIDRQRGMKLGIILAYSPQTHTVQVQGTRSEGAVFEWNERNPSKQIVANLHVIEVNGCKTKGMGEAELARCVEMDPQCLRMRLGRSHVRAQ